MIFKITTIHFFAISKQTSSYRCSKYISEIVIQFRCDISVLKKRIELFIQIILKIKCQRIRLLYNFSRKLNRNSSLRMSYGSCSLGQLQNICLVITGWEPHPHCQTMSPRRTTTEWTKCSTFHAARRAALSETAKTAESVTFPGFSVAKQHRHDEYGSQQYERQRAFLHVC